MAKIMMACQRQLPILGICGDSGTGKTTLIEALSPRLLAKGLRLAVVKHDARRVALDTPGKDSDRFFQAGADVALLGKENFFRWHGQEALSLFLERLCESYDLVLVEGHKKTPLPKIWLQYDGQDVPTPDSGEILQVFSRTEVKQDVVLPWIEQWLAQQWQQTPVYGCILIGGRSRRMGQPKHLIERDGVTWLESAVATMERQVDRIVLAGSGAIPLSLAHLPRIPDPPELFGPLAGILAVLRWQPHASWLVAACDQPHMREEAIAWLLTTRRPGVYAILPDLQSDGRVEPLLAYYDFRCRSMLEELAAAGCLQISRLAEKKGILTPRPPTLLHGSWRNVNTPDELTSL